MGHGRSLAAILLTGRTLIPPPHAAADSIVAGTKDIDSELTSHSVPSPSKPHVRTSHAAVTAPCASVLAMLLITAMVSTVPSVK